MMQLAISELPDRFFEQPHFKKNIIGFVNIKSLEALSDVIGFKFKLSSESMVYRNIVISFAGAIKTRFTCHIHGSDIEVSFGVNVTGAYFAKLWEGSSFQIGSHTTSNSTEVWVQKHGNVKIGSDCMFAHEVHIQCGDMHGIVDLHSGSQLNISDPYIEIGNHVWCGRNTSIVKNVKIGNGSIIGIGALVTQSFDKKLLVVGVPARIIKENVSWTRSEKSSELDIAMLRNL
tara:strand:- start:7583 stop:8275 length:693 start_codon:yes stop_codon:yes gene_type:complete